MKTVLDVILNEAKVLLEDAELTVKEATLLEDSSAKCIKTSTGYSIRSGKMRYGKGKTEERAWEDAIKNILGLGNGYNNQSRLKKFGF